MFFAIGMITFSSCGSNKTGCPVNENAHVKAGPNGELPTRSGKSNLFSKKMRKRTR